MKENELYFTDERTRNEEMRKYEAEGFVIVSSGNFLGPDGVRLFWFRYL